MRLLLIKVATAACFAVITTGRLCACQCGATSYGRNSWEAAKLQTDAATFVFEGTPERFELQWSVLRAKEGELISAGNASSSKNVQRPWMLVTFRVQRAYKGYLGSLLRPGDEIAIMTGLGGGDCGAIFEPGLAYLVFANATRHSEPQVSMCSPGDGLRVGV